jgi:hypothetical protein
MNDHAKKDSKKKNKKSKHAEEATSGFLAGFMRMPNSKDNEGTNKKGKKDKNGGKKREEVKIDVPIKAQAQEKTANLSKDIIKGKNKKEKKHQKTPTKNSAKKDGVKRDHIEQHRDDYEAEAETLPDSIEQHRAAYDGAQMHRHPDWYEQESLLGDLESLRRKPWYQKIKKEEYCPQESALYTTLRSAFPNPLNLCWGEQDEQDEEEDQGEEKLQSESEEIHEDSTSQTVDDAYEDALGLQDGIQLDFSSYMLPLPPLDKDRDRLEYARRTIERMQRIEELRKSRQECKAKMEAKRQRQKMRNDRIQKGGLNTNFLNPKTSKGGVSVLSDPEPLLVDLTGIFDDNRRIGSHGFGCSDERSQGKGCALQRVKVERCRSLVQKHIPIIVDLTNRHEPQQIIDLTNLEEPSIISSTPLESNRRLLHLRKQQEDKLRHVTSKYENMIKNKVDTKEKRDSALFKYQYLMERVTQNVRNSVCAS